MLHLSFSLDAVGQSVSLSVGQLVTLSDSHTAATEHNVQKFFVKNEWVGCWGVWGVRKLGLKMFSPHLPMLCGFISLNREWSSGACGDKRGLSLALASAAAH